MPSYRFLPIHGCVDHLFLLLLIIEIAYIDFYGICASTPYIQSDKFRQILVICDLMRLISDKFRHR